MHYPSCSQQQQKNLITKGHKYLLVEEEQRHTTSILGKIFQFQLEIVENMKLQSHLERDEVKE